MKPEDLLDPAEFPDDLKWVAAHHRLNPTDPVYLLVAWHWQRVKRSEDTLKASVLEMRAILDARIKTLTDAAEMVAGVNESLAAVQEDMEGIPAALIVQMEAKLTQPVAQALAQVKTLEKALGPLARNFQVAQRRQLLAALLVGVALGVLSAVILLLA